MSQPTAPEQVYERIRIEALESGRLFDGPRVLIPWVKQQMASAAADFSFMVGKTDDDYHNYLQDRRIKWIEDSKTKGVPSDKQFWEAAYAYDPMSGENRLVKMIGSGRLKPLVLGKLYGKYTLKLLPAIGALRVFDPNFDCDLDFAATDSTAIFYPDGHPSDDQVYTTIEEYFPSYKTAKVLAEIHPWQDDKLRRFASLGYILQENSQKQWRKTGHVLVMDMDEKKHRHRQPWLILASEWPTDGYETVEGDFTHRAPYTVRFGSAGEYGVLPEGHNRTPLAPLIAMDESQRNKVVLKQFGENFDFVPDRRGGHRRSKPSDKGPALAEAMNWYWDPVMKREVCFRNKMEYMYFNPDTKSYTFPNFSKMKIEGMNGLYGSLKEEADLEAGEVKAPADPKAKSGPRDLSVAMGGLSMTKFYPPERHRQSTTSQAF